MEIQNYLKKKQGYQEISIKGYPKRFARFSHSFLGITDTGGTVTVERRKKRQGMRR